MSRPPDINKSSFTFLPDVVTQLDMDLAELQKLVKNSSRQLWMDVLTHLADLVTSQNKAQVVNLIKSGAFDCFG